MIEAIKLWNEPNNLSHWDFQMDPEWREFVGMIGMAARAIRAMAPDLRLVLGGLSPIDPQFVSLRERQGALEDLDGVAVHGFPFDWKHWKIDAWPQNTRGVPAV